jgi:hypothetical protein
MKLKIVIPISLIAVFVMGLIVAPAFAHERYRRSTMGPERWTVSYEPQFQAVRYAAPEEDKPGLVAGVFDAADWLVSGSLDMAGATYDSTEQLTRNALTASGETVNSAVDTSGAIIDGSLKKSGEIVDGTMQFTDDTVKGTTGVVLGSDK